jgi:hypothetical protein
MIRRAASVVIGVGLAVLALVGCNGKSNPLTPVKALQSTRPANAKTYQAGDTIQLAWTINSGSITSLSVFVSLNNGRTYVNAAHPGTLPASPAAAVYVIPANVILPGQPRSDSCVIVIANAQDTSVKDQTNGLFTFTPKAVLLTSPVSGESYHVGDTMHITWVEDPAKISGIMIKLSVDQGMNFVNNDAVINPGNHQIAAGVKKLDYVIPASIFQPGDLPSSQCLILISDYQDATLHDQNAMLFSISN